ncbi:MAG: redoxin domain-containing protein [Anaerolineae bacterium]|nr:redoxin domain-containing protein [Anaerolineae bacterium]
MTHLTIGQPAPDFVLPSHLDKDIRLSDYRGKNVVLAFFPLAWTPVCSSQIPWYEADKARFAALDTQVFALSVDSVPCLKAWLDTFNGVTYPVLSDFWPHGDVAQKYGVLRSNGTSERALFIVDKQGIIRYIDIHDVDKQPDNEVLLAELRKIDPEAAAREPKTEKLADEKIPTGGVVMYCTGWCPDCRRARKWLSEHNVPYTEVNINSNPFAAQQVMRWNNGNRTTPTFDINGDVFANFDENKLVEVLKKHSLLILT